MDKPYLRHQILTHRTVLYKLYRQDQVLKTLNNASEDELNLILKLLHLIVNGRIKLALDAEDAIAKSLRSKKLQLFESRKYLHGLLHSTRANKLLILRQFNKLYSIFFYFIFNLPPHSK